MKTIQKIIALITVLVVFVTGICIAEIQTTPDSKYSMAIENLSLYMYYGSIEETSFLDAAIMMFTDLGNYKFSRSYLQYSQILYLINEIEMLENARKSGIVLDQTQEDLIEQDWDFIKIYLNLLTYNIDFNNELTAGSENGSQIPTLDMLNYYIQGRTLEILDQYEEAIECYQYCQNCFDATLRLENLAIHSKEYLYARAISLLGQGDYDTAAEFFLKLARQGYLDSELKYAEACKKGTITNILIPNIIVIENQANGIHLEWTAVENEELYRIFRKTEGFDWQYIGDTSALSFTDTSVQDNAEYTYTIRCVVIHENDVEYTSWYDEDGTSISFMKSGPIITNISINYSGIKIEWTQIPKTQKYRVFRKTETSDWQYMTDTGLLNYTDMSAQEGIEYTYTIRCIDKDGNYTSNYDPAGKSIKYKKLSRFIELERGAEGEEVVKLQNRLQTLGYFDETIDGDYGRQTEKAVQAFQKAVGLPVTGKADIETQERLFASDAPKATPSSTKKPSFSKTESPPSQETLAPTNPPIQSVPTSKPSSSNPVWGEWSEWSTKGVVSSDSRQVQVEIRNVHVGWADDAMTKPIYERISFYRYRDRIN